MSSPLVLVTADVREYDGYVWHCAASTYLNTLVHRAKAVPVILGAFGADIDIDAALDRVDGVLITGSRSNVHPSQYGEEPTTRHEPFDPARDATSLPLIRRAVERGIPLIGICRGIQDMNVAFGGSLATEIQEVEGNMDHRTPSVPELDDKYAIRHKVEVKPGGCLGRIVGADEIEVNSLHRQAIARLSDRLQIEAVSPDGVVEAVSVRGARGFALGVQWHPEYWALTDQPSGKIFDAFADACRAYMAGRSASRAA